MLANAPQLPREMGAAGIDSSLRGKRFRLLLRVLVLVNGARRTFSAKVGTRAKKRKRPSQVRRTLCTYPMETLVAEASRDCLMYY